MKTTVRTILKYVLKIALYLLSRCEQDACRKYETPTDATCDDYADDIKDAGV